MIEKVQKNVLALVLKDKTKPSLKTVKPSLKTVTALLRL